MADHNTANPNTANILETPKKPLVLKSLSPPLMEMDTMASSSTEDAGKDDNDRQTEPRPPSPEKPRSVPERIVEPTRTLCEISDSCRIFVDSSEEGLLPFGISPQSEPGEVENLVQKLLQLSLSLECEMTSRLPPDMNVERSTTSGQACLIQTAGIAGKVVLVTVKHNFCHETNDEGRRDFLEYVMLVNPAKTIHSNIILKKYSLLWDADQLTTKDAFNLNPHAGDPDAFWKYGPELLIVDLKGEDSSFLQDRMKAFEAISDISILKEDMQVGILAHSSRDLVAQSMQHGLMSGNTYDLRAGDTFVTVGKILHVGERHVEYQVNTVPGFSGGPVFLLCPGEQEHMKIIAVHAGYSQSLERNFGFLVSSHEVETSPHSPWKMAQSLVASMIGCFIRKKHTV